MLILFALVVIMYAIIGFNGIKLKSHLGKTIWARIIFFSTLSAVGLVYLCLAARLPDIVSNWCMIVGITIGLIFVFKYYFLNKSKFDPFHILHIIYVWVGASLVSTLIME